MEFGQLLVTLLLISIMIHHFLHVNNTEICILGMMVT